MQIMVYYTNLLSLGVHYHHDFIYTVLPFMSTSSIASPPLRRLSLLQLPVLQLPLYIVFFS